LHSAWVYSLVNNKSSNLQDLVSRAVKIDEKSRALPNKENADRYEELFGRFNGLTQRLATGGYL
jgi:hypothetical protein